MRFPARIFRERTSRWSFAPANELDGALLWRLHDARLPLRFNTGPPIRSSAVPWRRSFPMRATPGPTRTRRWRRSRLDPRVRLDQSDPGRRGRHDHRRPRPGAGGAQASGSTEVPVIVLAGWSESAEARLHHRRQQARAERRLGRRAARARARRPRRRSASTSTSIGFSERELAALAVAGNRRADRSRRGAGAARQARSACRATSGCSAGIGCSAATAPMPTTSSACSAACSPHLMVTDPPYGVDYDPAWRNAAGVDARTGASRQGAERRPRRLARGLGAVPRRRRLRLARRAARQRPSPRASKPPASRIRAQIIWAKERLVLEPRRLSLAARAVLVRGAEGQQGPLGRRPQADDALADPAAATRTPRPATAPRSRSSACGGRS